MSEPEWLDTAIVLDVHAEQLALFGGADGVRDLGLLESALGRPLNKFAYGDSDLASLAAAYAFGIAKNHPFVDGNKRTGLVAMLVFLGLNGQRLEAPDDELADLVLSVAAGRISKADVAVFVRHHRRPQPR